METLSARMVNSRLGRLLRIARHGAQRFAHGDADAHAAHDRVERIGKLFEQLGVAPVVEPVEDEFGEQQPDRPESR